jgi:hypothetical protein
MFLPENKKARFTPTQNTEMLLFCGNALYSDIQRFEMQVGW